MRNFLCILLISKMLFCACSDSSKIISEEGMETVVVGELDDNLLLNPDFVDNIEIISIKSDDVLLARSRQFHIYDGDYYFVNTYNAGNIARIDSAGTFLNYIGRRGRGPNEYIEMSDYHISPEAITIYSSDTHAYYYSADGAFKSKIEIPIPFHKIYPEKDGYWIYVGQGREKGAYPRLLFCDNEGNISIELLDNNTPISFFEDSPVFIQGKEGLYVRETFNNDVYIIDNKDLRVAYRFDFGKYNIPKAFYEAKDMMSAVDLFTKSEFAVIRHFFDSKHHVVVGISLQGPDNNDSHTIYGIKNKKNGIWRWIKYNSNDIFFDSILYMDNDSNLYAIVESYKLNDSGILDSDVIVNKDIAETFSINDNPSLLILHLTN